MQSHCPSLQTYLLVGNASFRFTLQLFFLQLFQIVLAGTACGVGNNSISSTSHSDELSFIDKTLDADVLCSPDDINHFDEEDDENTGRVCE